MKQFGDRRVGLVSNQQQIHRQVRDQARRIEAWIMIKEGRSRIALELKDALKADARERINECDKPCDSQPPDHPRPGIKERTPDRFDTSTLTARFQPSQLQGAFAA